MDYKIGIGITTTSNRKDHYSLFMNQLTLHANTIEKLSVCRDSTSIAKAKNKCLDELKDCDYIFLFDDDCFPIADGWAEFFIDMHKATDNHHFMYLNHTHQHKDSILFGEKFNTPKPVPSFTGPTWLLNNYKSCGGCFMFLTKEVIEKVGYYYSGYGRYGYEHAGYTNRIHQAGLTPSGMYLCPANSHKYLHSLDLDLPVFDIKHNPSLTISEVIKSTEANKAHYLEDIKQVFRSI